MLAAKKRHKDVVLILTQKRRQSRSEVSAHLHMLYD